MSHSLLETICDIEDPRFVGMTAYPLDEILLTVFVGKAVPAGVDPDSLRGRKKPCHECDLP